MEVVNVKNRSGFGKDKSVYFGYLDHFGPFGRRPELRSASKLQGESHARRYRDCGRETLPASSVPLHAQAATLKKGHIRRTRLSRGIGH